MKSLIYSLALCRHTSEREDYFQKKLYFIALYSLPKSAGQIENVCQTIMGESSDLIGVSKYILEQFENGNEKCNDLSYSAIITTLLESKYTGGISKSKSFTS